MKVAKAAFEDIYLDLCPNEHGVKDSLFYLHIPYERWVITSGIEDGVTTTVSVNAADRTMKEVAQ
jgi:hypothetical protein